MKSIENIGNFIVGILISLFSILYYVCQLIHDIHYFSSYWYEVIYCVLIVVPLIILLIEKKQSWIMAWFFHIVIVIEYLVNLILSLIYSDLGSFYSSSVFHMIYYVLIVLFLIISFFVRKGKNIFLIIGSSILVLMQILILIMSGYRYGLDWGLVPPLLSLLISILIQVQMVIIAVSSKAKKKQYDYSIVNKSNADILTEYKELLDMGAITTEEFEQKKKEIMNL